MFPIHDRGYKRLFSHPRLFRQLLETFVAEEWVKELDFDHCTKMEKSFISKHYKATETDLLYQVKLRGQPAYIYILIEFQSTVTWFMVVRLLHYLSSFWLDYAENHPQNQKLPPVFPILLYSGDERWNAATDLAQLLENPELFKNYTPQFRYCAIAENAYTPAQLLQINNLVSTLFLAETHYDLELLSSELLNLFDREPDKEAISLLLNWFKQLVVHGRRDGADYDALEQVYHDKLEAQNMLETAIARERALIFAQGEAEGIAKGKAEGEAIGSANFLISLLEKRFGSLTPEQQKQLQALQTPTLLTL
ncbi:MAG: Rpn family recombination-promoting nuclease/putative transposase, partial [Pseudomonadota bacterium]|nr:Rpn family recombination-promoting nuclease/putative transposase [Pseudomonadota bacterium]